MKKAGSYSIHLYEPDVQRLTAHVGYSEACQGWLITGRWQGVSERGREKGDEYQLTHTHLLQIRQ